MAKKKRHHGEIPPLPPSADPAVPAEAAAEDVPPAGSDEAPAPKTPAWRAGLDFIGMISLAVAAALLIKAYVMDIYLIPSGSMETALHGRPDGGDRIFSSKLSYRFRDLRRWEVAVFKFPYATARQNDRYGMVSPEYEGQNFVKRVIGLPGETVAIGRGDIWVRPSGARTPYERVGKPDSVQRGMWLKVYEEDFADISLPEFERFWKIIGDAAVERGALVLRPGAGGVRLDYRPMAPAGEKRDRMVELPGIPDRYVLEQPVQFRCAECGHVFVTTVAAQNVQGRCPACGHLSEETEAVFYHRRSGLPEFGRYAVSPASAPQGEQTQPRQDEYNFVPDLRVVAGVSLASRETVFSVALREDERFVQIALSGDGLLELRVNGRSALPQHRAPVGIAPGREHALECYVTEGRARVFLDGAAAPVLDEQVWTDERPFPRNAPRSSGVSLLAGGGEVRVRGLSMDRDVFYYSGWEHDRGEKYQALNSRGEIAVGERHFFPMGDHTSSSFDARSWGAVPLGLLQGPALFIWWPPERAGAIPSP